MERLLICGLFLLGCSKQTDCTVTRVFKGSDRVVEVGTTSNTTVVQVETDYIVVMECY